MPQIMPGEHILSVVRNAVELGAVTRWNDLINENEKDGSEFCPGHVLRPLYAASAAQYCALDLCQIIENHTLWRYYRSFLPGQPALPPAFPQWNLLYNHTQLLHPVRLIRYRHTKQWRWCHQCALEDFQNYGISYWHVMHQVPSESRCYQHPEQILLGACENCGLQVTDIRNQAIKLRLDGKCPVCQKNESTPVLPPFHPLLDWISETSKKLMYGHRFDVNAARSLIFETLEFDPDSKRTVNSNRNAGKAQKLIDKNLPREVINWLFQNQNRGPYMEAERVAPLILRQLYDRESFTHPLSWLALAWIVLSSENKHEELIKV